MGVGKTFRRPSADASRPKPLPRRRKRGVQAHGAPHVLQDGNRARSPSALRHGIGQQRRQLVRASVRAQPGSGGIDVVQLAAQTLQSYFTGGGGARPHSSSPRGPR